MQIGILLLGLAYVLSQFYRAFLAVLTEILEADLGVAPDALATASGLWFLTFAACQIPIGAALDGIGPRRTAGWLLLLGGAGGAAIFALAESALHINIAMALIGVGCAPVLMASYYIFGRDYPPARFAFLASIMVALGSLGNLVAAYPMAFAAEALGWRNTLWALSALTAAVAIGTLALVKDPAKVAGEARGSFGALLRIRALWFLFPLMGVSYAFPGAARGLWIGPYLADVFARETAAIGQATLLMGVAMVVGAFAYGTLDRALPSRKWMILAGTVLALASGLYLVILPQAGFWPSVAAFCGIGFFGATYPVIMAHGRSFLPPELIGRGVTLLNLFSIGGVGIAQFASARVYRAALPAETAATPYVAVFVLFSAALAVGTVIYLFSADRSD